jgi:hypothetical protein
MAEQTQRANPNRLAKKLLMPVVATAVSAVATYAGKKAPQLFEEKVLPKLRNAASGSDDLAGSLADRAKSLVGGGDGDGNRSSRARLSASDLETRRSERAEHRQARRNGARS